MQQKKLKFSSKNISLGFALHELLIAAALSSILMLQLMRIALDFECELRHQQQHMALIQAANFLSLQLREAIHAAGKSECVPGTQSPAPPYQLLKNGFSVWRCFTVNQKTQWLSVTYYQSQGNLYRKPAGVRAERLMSGVKQFLVQNKDATHFFIQYTLTAKKQAINSEIWARVGAT